MRKNSLILLSMALAVVLSAQISVQAEENLMESVGEGCQKELDTFCKDVGFK
jgi:hypothetical protein